MTDENADAIELERITREERELVFTRFTRDDAWALGVRLREAALEQELPITIGITVGQQRVFHTALDGASAENDDWLARKTRAVLYFGRSSLGVGARFRGAGRDYATEARVDPNEIAADGGVFPITVAGVGVIGAVGVSGLPQYEDHAFVVEQLRAFLADAER